MPHVQIILFIIATIVTVLYGRLLKIFTTINIIHPTEKHNNISVQSHNENFTTINIIHPTEKHNNISVQSHNENTYLSIQAPMNNSSRSFRRGQLKENAVVIFIHVPKTGGVSIVSNVKRGPVKMKYFLFINEKKKTWSLGKDYIDHYCSSPGTTYEEKQSVFLELHTLAPAYMEIQDQIQAWRTNATTNGKELFVFTILREPVSWALSAFNYVHTKKVNELMTDPNTTTINTVMRSIAQENPQCSFLAHSWIYPQAPDRRRWSAKKKDCDLLLNSLMSQIDYIGITERHQETLEMLRYLLDFPMSYTFTHENPAGVRNGKKNAYIKHDRLTNETIQYHKDISLLDYELYHSVQSEWGLKFDSK
jgi:hypothetical protein